VRGFKIENGRLVKLMVLGSVSTAMMGVNDKGDLVGFYRKPDTNCSPGIYHGFLWLHTNVVKTIDYPGTSFCGNQRSWNVPMGINHAGTVVGTLWNAVMRAQECMGYRITESSSARRGARWGFLCGRAI
jgi:hypothetical protein